jgi:hypothetical protein
MEPRAQAAKIGGMDRQTLRDWVIRFNDAMDAAPQNGSCQCAIQTALPDPKLNVPCSMPDGLFNIASPGVPPKLDATHRAFLARIVEGGPILAVHGVVRWRACDLIMRLHEEFGVSVSDDTIYRALKDLGFALRALV